MYELSVIVSVMFLAPIRFLTEQVSWFSFEPDIPDYQIIFLNVLIGGRGQNWRFEFYV